MSLEFSSLVSGSSGNCHYIGSKDGNFLVDAGLSGVQIEKLIRNIDRHLEDIDGIFVTHEHSDHIRGVGVLSRRYDIPIYANKGTWEAMEKDLGKISDKNIKIFDTNSQLDFKGIGIKPISIYHDAKEPVGYIVEDGKKKISIITDTGRLDGNILDNMRDSDLYLIESNHDIQMLRNGNYPYHLQERIRSDYGHLSNDYTSKAIKSLVKGKGEKIILGHLSKDNNTPKMAFNQTAFTLMELGLELGKDIKLELTYRNKNTKLFKL